MKHTIQIKEVISEKSIRQAMGLAFVDSPEFPVLIQKNNVWTLGFEAPPPTKHVDSFRLHLNDYALREVVESKTNQLREAIITKALLNIYGKE